MPIKQIQTSAKNLLKKSNNFPSWELKKVRSLFLQPTFPVIQTIKTKMRSLREAEPEMFPHFAL